MEIAKEIPKLPQFRISTGRFILFVNKYIRKFTFIRKSYYKINLISMRAKYLYPKLFSLFTLLIIISSAQSINAQYNTTYKKQVKFIVDEKSDTIKSVNFQFTGDSLYVVNMTSDNTGMWEINISKNSLPYRTYKHAFNVIHQVGLFKTDDESQTCILIVSATGGNGIVTNEFSVINPDFPKLINVQINYLLQAGNNVTYNYNEESLIKERNPEIKFVLYLIGEYNMIKYSRYKEEKK